MRNKDVHRDVERLSSLILSPAPIWSFEELNRRLDAIDKLASMGPQVIPVLSKVVYHTHPNVREHAVLGLGKVGGDQAITILRGLLDNPDSNLVYCAVKAMGETEGDEGISVLTELIKRKGQKSTKREEALVETLEILADKGGKEGEDVVMEACSRNYPSYLRLTAIEQLPKLSTSKLAECLETILQDDDWVIVEKGMRALKKIGGEWANGMIEKYNKRTMELKEEWGKKSREEHERKVTQKIICAGCKKGFNWNEAYIQRDTPGSHMHNPPGHGNFRPRTFCPHCGFLVAEWDIDRYRDRGRWKWHEENAKMNWGRELPPSPLTLWGRPVPPDARVTVPEDHIDTKLVRRLLGEIKETEVRAATLSPQQIFANANEELDNFFRSRAGHLDRRKEAFETLKSYVEGKGRSDAKAIALLGMIEYYDGKRDVALEIFNRSMAVDESCALSHLGLGILDYWDARTAKRGLKRLSKTISLDPSLIDAYVWKARIQKQRFNDPQGAWDTLQRAVSTVGENQLKEHSRGHFLFLELGKLCIYDEMGVPNEAIHYFETALTINPNSYDAPMYLMYIYRMLGKWAEAARTQAAYERADQGFGLSSEAINAIRRFVIKSSVQEKPERKWRQPGACPSCGNVNRLGDRFCRKCGTPLPTIPKEEKAHCTRCGTELKKGAKFCHFCGQACMRAQE